jgi:hypothetical protein
LGGLWAAYEIRDKRASIGGVADVQHLKRPAPAADLPKSEIPNSIVPKGTLPEVKPIRYTVRFPAPNKHIAEVAAK